MIRIVVNDNDVNRKAFRMLTWENTTAHFYGLIERLTSSYFCLLDLHPIPIVSFVYCEEDLARMV